MKLNILLTVILFGMWSYGKVSATTTVQYDAGNAGDPVIAPDPTTQGWLFNTTGQALLSSGPVSPDGTTGLNAWNITDALGSGYNYNYYYHNLNSNQLTQSYTDGWRMTTYSRFLDSYGFHTGPIIQFTDILDRRYVASFELSEDDELVVNLYGQGRFTLTDSQASKDYHLHEIEYDPITDTASYYFDGSFIHDNWAAKHDLYSDPGRIVWGASSTAGMGNMNYNYVSFEVIPEPTTIVLITPNGGEILVTDSTYTITWESSESVQAVKIEFSSDNGQNWETVDPNDSNGYHEWTVPVINSNQCLIRITDNENSLISDTSDSVFTIFECDPPIPGDVNGDCYLNLADIAIIAENWPKCGNPFDPMCYNAPEGMVWVSINDPGVAGHEGFDGEMSKYETTNSQYCKFLNSAKTDGLIMVYEDKVYASSDTSYLQVFFLTYPSYVRSQITYTDGVFSVRTRDDYDMSNHPVIYVSWYGATAFCDYYGYRLPTEWEWQAVADYDGSFIYGCGVTINQSKANYRIDGVYANPLGLSSYPFTTPVVHYPSYGYGMNDMAGNLWEWTNTVSSSSRIIRGGRWNGSQNNCMVSFRKSSSPSNTHDDTGFRVCR